MNKQILQNLSKNFGDAFYLLDSKQFAQNYAELKKAFSEIYPHFNIAYSYKTNYTPKFCKLVNELGGYAEVVSDMEAEIALKVGVKPQNIIWNGPYKNLKELERLIVLGVIVNIDSLYESDFIRQIAEKYPKNTINLGIRCNFDIGDGVVSRFGFDVESDDFKNALALFDSYPNLNFIGLQCHFATRKLETWKPRAEKMLALIDALKITPKRIDLGGGLFGKMADSLKAQFDGYIPTYREYAKEVATVFAERYKDEIFKPELVIEPGSALVGDCMKFVSKVVNIKNIRGKNIATLLGSIYNINPTLNKKNPPIEIVSMGEKQKEYENLDFGGFTCIESDYLYKHFNGKLAVGDFAVFGNAGSYSVVLKPPFILPNFPVLEITDKGVEVIKRGECFDDIFHTFTF
ncbi:MAG: alanine racemase [Clostridia bacterium]|nr:alanine racemase [Clostridia bacterium]